LNRSPLAGFHSLGDIQPFDFDAGGEIQPLFTIESDLLGNRTAITDFFGSAN
jgi:hypothetical protein